MGATNLKASRSLVGSETVFTGLGAIAVNQYAHRLAPTVCSRRETIGRYTSTANTSNNLKVAPKQDVTRTEKNKNSNALLPSDHGVFFFPATQTNIGLS